MLNINNHAITTAACVALRIACVCATVWYLTLRFVTVLLRCVWSSSHHTAQTLEEQHADLRKARKQLSRALLAKKQADANRRRQAQAMIQGIGDQGPGLYSVRGASHQLRRDAMCAVRSPHYMPINPMDRTKPLLVGE